jgi:signal transduction histidine kinase
MRDLVWTMKPENSTLDSLVARLREYAYEYVEDFPIHLQFTTTDNIPSTLISKSVSRNVQMIFKEALQNIVKHASAKNIKITLTINPRFELNIHDDGKGFSPQVIKEGNGLKNMQQRSEAIGAMLHLKTEENQGTNICLTLDLDK